MNEPLADNTIREIDPNNNDIDQNTKDACNLYNTMFHSPEKNELWDEQLELGVNYDWSCVQFKYPKNMSMGEIESFIINKSKFRCDEVVEEKQSNDHLNIPLDNNGNPFAIENLQDDQRQAFFHVMKTVQNWIHYKKSVDNKTLHHNIKRLPQLLLTISGEGGSGKSTLIKNYFRNT